MMFMPKRVKHRKSMRGKRKGQASRGNRVCFGDYGLMSLEGGWVSARQLEAGRIAASHFMGSAGRLFIRVFPHKSITKKPLETRMGKGKAEPEFWAANVLPGTIIYEVGGVDGDFAKALLNRIAHKMCVKTKLVTRKQYQ